MHVLLSRVVTRGVMCIRPVDHSIYNLFSVTFYSALIYRKAFFGLGSPKKLKKRNNYSQERDQWNKYNIKIGFYDHTQYL